MNPYEMVVSLKSQYDDALPSGLKRRRRYL
jgi:hypothetical protein